MPYSSFALVPASLQPFEATAAFTSAAASMVNKLQEDIRFLEARIRSLQARRALQPVVLSTYESLLRGKQAQLKAALGQLMADA